MEHISQTAFDQMVSSDTDQFYKAIIPYLPPKSRQMLSIFLKASELSNTIQLFSKQKEQLEICNTSEKDPINILNDIHSYCYGKTKEQLNGLINTLSLIKMMQTMNDAASMEDEYGSKLEK